MKDRIKSRISVVVNCHLDILLHREEYYLKINYNYSKCFSCITIAASLT